MNEENKEPKTRLRYRGSLIGPVVLITIGVIFLLSNLGTLSGDPWTIILNLWPLVLIAIGLDGIVRRHGLAGPTFMIGLGLVFLLHNFGLLALNVWDLLLRLWPILLIAIGLDIVFGRRSIWGAILALVLMLVILAGVLLYFGSDIAADQFAGQEVSQSLDEISKAVLSIKPAVGSLNVDKSSAPTRLVDGVIHRWRGETVHQDYSISNGIGTFTLHSEGLNMIYPTSSQFHWSWDLGVSPEIPMDLDVEMGAGEIQLNLSGLQVSNLEVSLGVGKTTVVLPAFGEGEAEISGAVGEMFIIVPSDIAVRIQSDIGLANIRVPNDYVREDDIYTSPDYTPGGNYIDLVVSQAIGLVVVIDND